MSTTKAARKTRKPARAFMEMPAGAYIDLDGLKNITGYGDDMVMRGYSGDLGVSAREQQLSVVGGDTSRLEHVSGEALVGVGSGVSQVLVKPIGVGLAVLCGLPSVSEEMGVVVGGSRYFFNSMLRRGERGVWSPLAGAPASFGYYVVDKDGVGQPPDVVKVVFDMLFRAVELYYRSNERMFVMAELAWYNNTILEYEGAAEAVRVGRASDQMSSDFYRARFSGKVGAMRKAEEKLLEWLAQN